MRKRIRLYHAVSFIVILCLTILILQSPADSATYTNTVNFNPDEGLSWNYNWQQCLSGIPPGATINSAQIEVRTQVWYWGYHPNEQDILASDTNSFNFSEGYVYTLNSATNPSSSNFYTTSHSLSAPQLEWIQNDGCINFMMVTYGGTYYMDFAKLTAEATEKISTPTFTPLPGPYNTSQDVYINCDTSGVTIYYTKDSTNPDENSTLYDGTAINVSETTTIKARAFKDGWSPSEISTGNFIIDRGNKTTLYLRDNEVMSEEMGDPVPWLTKYIYPQGATTSMQWLGTLEGDITGFFHYSVDVVGSAAPATLKVEFILDRGVVFPTLATDYADVGIVNEGAEYQTVTNTIGGLNLPTQDGDILIFKISYESGTEKVAVALDGQNVYSDSHVRISYLGPVACFAVSPEKGDLNTAFNFDASCSFDDIYPTSELQVRWDWENDGTYDTSYNTEKTAVHQFNSSGVKFVKLQVRNPDGTTRTRVMKAIINWVVLNSFSSPGLAPAGLTWDGTNLWLSDSNSGSIYKLTPDGQVIDSFASPCGDPLDLAWDGTYLWIIDAWGSDGEGNVLYKVDTSGSVITSFNLPSDYSTGLTWDGHFLWAGDGTNGRIAKIDPNTGAVVLSFASPGPDPRGLGWDGQYLWNADWTKQEIYRLDVNGNVINTYPSPGTGPMGLTLDGSYLWCVDLDSYKIFKLTDRIPTSITCNLSRSNITLGELPTVSGRIRPSPEQAGLGVSVELISPTDNSIFKTAFANVAGEFEYTPACGDIDRAGAWKVRTSWAGDGPYEGAASEDQTLLVAKAGSRVTVDVTSQAIKIEDPVSISGKFTPQPDCGDLLSGISIDLQISGPGGVTDSQVVQTYDQWGHFVLPGYTGINDLGEWTVQAVFAGSGAYESTSSETMQVRVIETAGYAVVVQGKISSEEGLASHDKTASFVYNQLVNRGLLDDDIMYFNYDVNKQGVDGIPSKSAIADAITIWARDKMNLKPANLYIVMVDHGLDDKFYVYPDTITSADLSGWLNTLQAELNGQSADQEIVTILGFCRSGSFIDDLSSARRVIISSAAPEESSYRGPLDEDGIREGAYFVSLFFREASLGKSIRQSFEEAVTLIETFTASPGLKKTNAPYYDQSLQHPLLDDNGDGVGSNDLSDQTGDGLFSNELFIGVSSITGNDPGDVAVIRAAETIFLGEGENTANLWARVDDNQRLMTIWTETKPPGYSPLDPGGSGQAEMDLTKAVSVNYNTAQDRYEWAGLGDFSTPGIYQVFYFAKDDFTGNVSPLRETRVYKAESGNLAPNPFSLVVPNEGASVLTSVMLDWKETNDPNGDRLTYTVLISKDDNTFSDPIRIEGLEYSTCLVGFADGLEDLSTYYWKVRAIDEYGAIRESNVRSFSTNNTNDPRCWVQSRVYNSATGRPIPGAVVTVGSYTLNAVGGDYAGYYLGGIDPDTYTITASADGYNAMSYTDVSFPSGGYITKDFAMELNTAKAATPTYSPVPGSYLFAQNVEFESATQGATIHYSIGDSEPDESSPVYSSPIAVPVTMNIKARAYKVGYEPSGTVTASYTITTPMTRGDINGKGIVDLADAVVALQMMASIAPAANVHIEADVNNDGKIGLEEVIYILQKVSGLR